MNITVNNQVQSDYFLLCTLLYLNIEWWPLTVIVLKYHPVPLIYFLNAHLMETRRCTSIHLCFLWSIHQSSGVYIYTPLSFHWIFGSSGTRQGRIPQYCPCWIFIDQAFSTGSVIYCLCGENAKSRGRGSLRPGPCKGDTQRHSKVLISCHYGYSKLYSHTRYVLLTSPLTIVDVSELDAQSWIDPIHFKGAPVVAEQLNCVTELFQDWSRLQR